MKLIYSPASPFVRKVMIAAHELGLADRVQRVDGAAHPVNRDGNIIVHNPLGQVPTLLLDDGSALYDSGIICQHLDQLAGGGRIIPAGGMERLFCLRDHALGDGILNAALLIRFERTLRPEGERSQTWEKAQFAKISSGLEHLDRHAEAMEGRLDIATITFACALGYLGFRLPDYEWRDRFAALARWHAGWERRPSYAATTPKG